MLDKALVVEDDARLRAWLCKALAEYGLVKRELPDPTQAQRGWSAMSAGSVAEALSLLDDFEPSLVLLDYRLPDGNAKQILEPLTRQARWPSIIVISGEANATDAFELAQLGVRHYLPKPVTPRALQNALAHAASEPQDLVPPLRHAVGLVGVHDVEELVRDTMLVEALGRAHGNRSGAARLLGVSRQLLQHMLRALGERQPSGAAPARETAAEPAPTRASRGPQALEKIRWQEP